MTPRSLSDRSCGGITSALVDLARGVMGVPHLVAQNAALEAENTRLRDELAARVDELEGAVDELDALARELYTGPRPSRSRIERRRSTS